MERSHSTSNKRKAFMESIRGLTNHLVTLRPGAFSNDEFRTRLTFDPSKLSTSTLKSYLRDNVLMRFDPKSTFSGEPPEQYLKDPMTLTNYNAIRDLSMKSTMEWKNKLERDPLNVENLYLNDDTIVKDSQYYYECWKTIHNEVGNHEKEMSFFRLVSEIVQDLSNRNVVEISCDGDFFVSKNYDIENIMKQMKHREDLPADAKVGELVYHEIQSNANSPSSIDISKATIVGAPAPPDFLREFQSPIQVVTHEILGHDRNSPSVIDISKATIVGAPAPPTPLKDLQSSTLEKNEIQMNNIEDLDDLSESHDGEIDLSMMLS